MFRYREDRLPTLLIFCLFAVDLSVYFFVDHWFLLLAYALLSMLPKAGVCAYNHHHQHVSTFTWALPNRVLEFVFALMTGVSSQAWVLHHSLGHHVNYLDQEKDESRWRRKDGSLMGEWEYAFEVAVTSYSRAWQVGARYPKQRRLFVVMGVFTLGLFVTLWWFRPLAGLLVFGLTPLGLLYGTALATYTHHSGRSTASHFVACNNILQPFYNVLTGNLGYHTAHHYKPGVHWSKLKELHAEIASQIPDDAYVEPGYPWKWMGTSWRPSAPVQPQPAASPPSLAPVAGMTADAQSGA
jgi:fatty acid desaturase